MNGILQGGMMKLFLRNYLLLILLSLLVLFSCVEKITTDSNNSSTTPPTLSLSLDYGISENLYIALTNTAIELIQKTDFGSQSNFSVSPSLPNGLSLNVTNGNISGTSINSSLPTAYTVTATLDGKSYTKVISLGVAPSIAWVTPISSNYLKAYLVGDGAKQISDWNWGSSDENLLTVVNGLVSLNPTAMGGSSAIIYAKKGTSVGGSAQVSYSNGISITLQDVNGSKTMTIGRSIHLIINSGTTTVTNSQFKSKQLTSVMIPDSITNIGPSAFSLNQLTSVVIPNGITYISQSAFSFNRLTNVVIPNSVTNIGTSAFSANRLTSMIIPNSVRYINDSAFSANWLTSVVIPNSIVYMGNSVFYNNRLTSVAIPNSITYIDTWVFRENQLINLLIPDNITNIAINAFTGNPNLVEVSLKQSLYAKITNTSSANAVFGTQVNNYIKRP